ncbi:uncharacterized protein LOC124819256 isoform X2 [Hydra vulgaris]|uniref:uncharacterized protein LOC124806172 isoform X2 n=1 Tax=Hydra vulgaris TaxID=6087 RepID=UPI001F5F91C3|nr:uncharacterized protein LOC124806517 isoform X2 [Hydra vulgaris]XP_047129243.1 uncharacterized protein LOC124809276 isoform X2 [Hydra vulgaris]XP_047143383.1 uncharacterized protein LOC124817408 isoform X2 [Hydra vulgaris]XP_047146673.1 uncharacterized protein LOC124819256 isoform X2 [Hydra vulgaris]
MDKLYHIVKFIDEKDSVAVVPAKWVTNGICLWPCSYKTERLNRAIKKCEVPGDDWTEYDISIMYNSVSYEKAREKLPMAEVSSDFFSNNEGEDSINSEENRIQKSLRPTRDVSYHNFDYSSSESDTQQLLKKQKKVMNKKKKTLAPAPPIHPLTLFSTENLTLSDHLKSNKRQGSVLEVLEEKFLGSSLTSSGCSTVRRILAEVSEGTLHCTAVEKELLISVENLNKKLDTNNALISQLIGMLKQNREAILVDEPFEIPVNDESSLLKLNENIESDKKVMNALSMKLASHGGSTIKRTVWNLIPMVIGTNIEKKINWSGANNKLALKTMPLKKVLLDAVKINPSTSGAVSEEVERWIKRYFQLSGDRNGGRKAREDLKNSLQK